MSFAVVQSPFFSMFGQSSGTLNISATTAGNALGILLYAAQFADFVSLTDNQSNTYSQIVVSNVQSGCHIAAYYLENIPAGINAIDVDYSAGIGIGIIAYEVSGAVLTSVVDQNNINNSSSSGSATVGLTPTVTNSLIIATGCEDGSRGFTGVDAPFILDQNQNNGRSIVSAHLAVTSKSPVTFNAPLTSADNWNALIFNFAGPGGSGGGGGQKNPTVFGPSNAPMILTPKTNFIGKRFHSRMGR